MLCQLGIWLLEYTRTFKHSLSIKILVNKEPWCFHCDQKFASYSKSKGKLAKYHKENSSKSSNQRKKPQSTKIRKQHKQQSNLFMYKRKTKTKTKILPIPENL